MDATANRLSLCFRCSDLVRQIVRQRLTGACSGVFLTCVCLLTSIPVIKAEPSCPTSVRTKIPPYESRFEGSGYPT